MRKIYTLSAALICLCYFHPLFGQSYYSQNNNTRNGNTQVQTGNAVYYADYLAGRTTAMGEIYRPEAYTAAHKTYPKGTLLRVTRLDNGQSVVVRVNDRGPYDEGVIVDLSKAAAMDIGLLRDGRAKVRIEVVGRSEDNPRRGQLPRQYQQERQPQSYSSNTYRQPSRSEAYPGAASRSSYRSAPTRNRSNSAYQNNTYSQNQPDAYSNYSRRSNDSSRSEELTAKNGYSENLYRQQPQSYSQNSYTRPRTTRKGYTPAGETNSSLRSRSGSSNTRNNSGLLLPSGTKGYAVQLASYKNTDNAQRQVQQFQDKGLNNLYIWRKGGYNKIIIAIFPTKTSAQQYLESVRRTHQIDGLVVKVN